MGEEEQTTFRVALASGVSSCECVPDPSSELGSRAASKISLLFARLKWLPAGIYLTLAL